MKQPVLIGALLVLIGAIGSSSKAIFIKLSYPYGIDALSLLAIRMLMVFPIFLVIAIFTRKQGYPKPRLGDYLAVLPIGLLGYYLASLFDFIGLQFIPAAIERLILFTYPTLVVLLSWLLLKKTITRTQWIALILAYAGIFVVLGGEIALPDKGNLWKGGLWVFVAALAYSLYIIGSSRLIPKFGAVRFTALAMSVASFGVFVHAFLAGATDLWRYDEMVYVYTAWMGLLSTIIPGFFISEGIKRIGPGNTAIIGSVGPVSTIVLAYLFLGEKLSWLQILGTGIVMTGVLLISTQKKTSSSSKEKMLNSP